MFNVSGVRKGTGGGPKVVFAAHTDTVFPAATDLKVKREGDVLRAPGVGDDTSNLMAVLEMFRALNRAGIKTKGDLIFLASTQEEVGLLGAKHWLETSGYRPDMFVAADVSSNEVWYGALRIDQFKFFYTSPGAHTMESRGGPSPAKAVAKAITALYEIPLPPIAEGLETFKLPVLNVGMLGGGTVVNAVPREAWFTVDLRSLDSATQDRLETRRRLHRAANCRDGRRGFPDGEENGHRLFEGFAAEGAPQPSPWCKPRSPPPTISANRALPRSFPADVGSTDANIAVSMGIPAVAIGAIIERMPHRLEENADARSIVPGIKILIALAVASTSH